MKDDRCECRCTAADIIRAKGCPRRALTAEDTRPPERDPWLEAGVQLGKTGRAYSAIVAFICGVLTCALGVWVVARWVL